MIPFNLLLALVGFFFVAHVILLFTSFSKNGFLKRRYLWSHLTLWFAGISAYLVVFLYAGKGVSPVADLFDTGGKQALLPGLAVVLSIVAHTIVQLFVLPRYAAPRN